MTWKPKNPKATPKKHVVCNGPNSDEAGRPQIRRNFVFGVRGVRVCSNTMFDQRHEMTQQDNEKNYCIIQTIIVFYEYCVVVIISR